MDTGADSPPVDMKIFIKAASIKYKSPDAENAKSSAYNIDGDESGSVLISPVETDARRILFPPSDQ
jgi:hypothetical protein